MKKNNNLGCFGWIVLLFVIGLIMFLFSLIGGGVEIEEMSNDYYEKEIDKLNAMEKSYQYDDTKYINDFYRENNINKRFE